MACHAGRFLRLAQDAATEAGFPDFNPDACLINCYLPGTRLSLHQDRDERDFNQPIVSVSFGLPAAFLFGGRREAIGRSACCSSTATWWFGAAKTGCVFTG